MSNESSPECLIHKDSRNVQTRLDYMLLYRSEPKAKIIRILETWTNHRYAEWYKSIADRKEQHSAPPVEDLWITMSYDQFSLFVYGTIQRDTIKQQVDDLVALRHIQRRTHPDIPYGPPQYLLNRGIIQKALDDLEIPTNLFDLGGLFIAPRKKHTPQEKYPQGRGKEPPRVGVFIPPGSGETSYPSKKHTKNYRETTKNYERENAFAVAQSSPAGMPSEEDFHFYGTEQQHLTWNCRNWCAGNHGTCEDYVAAIAAGLHERTTDKMPVVPPGNVTTVSCSQPVYKQEMAKHNVTDATSLEGETNGHLPATAHPDVGSTRTERAMGGTEQGTIDGHVAPIEQTVSGLFPGAVPARHSGQALDGAASTAPPCSELRASDDHVPAAGKEIGDVPPMAETAVQIRKRVDRRADDLLALYCALMGDKITRSKENMNAMRELAQDDRSDEEVTLVMRNILDDPDDFLARQLTPRKLAKNFTPRLRTARGSKQTTKSTAQEEPERDYTGFDVYKGNGPEERAYYAAIGASLPDSYFDQ